MSTAVVRSDPGMGPGIPFTRLVGCLINGAGDNLGAIAFAKSKGWHDLAAAIHKSVITPGSTGDATDAAPLVPVSVSQDWQSYLRTSSAMLQMAPSMKPFPFYLSMPRVTAGSHVGFRAEGTPISVTKLSTEKLGPLTAKSVGAISVISDELARFSTPAAEKVLRADLGAANASALDATFLDRTNSGSSATPAAITYGQPVINSSGSTALQFASDLADAFASMASYGCVFGAPFIIANSVLVSRLAFLRTTTGASAFPDLGVKGGFINGCPLIACSAIPIQSSDVSDVAVIDASLIGLADDGLMDVSVSRQATIEMDTAPDNPTDAGSVMTSLYQENLTAARVLKFCNWLALVPNAVACTIANVPTA